MPAQLPGSEALSTAAIGISVLLKLGIVVLLIYGSLFLIKRWQSVIGTGPRKRLTLLETTHLSPRQALHLVRIGDRVFLIGATDQSVSLLSRIEEEQLASSGAEGDTEASARVDGNLVERLMARGNGITREARPLPDFASVLMNVFGKR